MAQYLRTESSNEGVRIFVRLLSDKFRDFVCHTNHCRNANIGVKFLLSLPFVSGTSVENISCPSHIYVNVVPFASEVCVLIGGRLSTEENLAIRSVAAAKGIKTESICSAGDGTAVQRHYLEAMAKLQQDRPERKWWQVRQLWKKESKGQPALGQAGVSQQVTSPKESDRTRDCSGKVKKCLACGTEIPSGGLECPACGSARFIWE
jgi:DNA-directed RNA polymerase subunit RPC12/RpoP